LNQNVRIPRCANACHGAMTDKTMRSSRLIASRAGLFAASLSDEANRFLKMIA
jgi:hypothetical protein